MKIILYSFLFICALSAQGQSVKLVPDTNKSSYRSRTISIRRRRRCPADGRQRNFGAPRRRCGAGIRSRFDHYRPPYHRRRPAKRCCMCESEA